MAQLNDLVDMLYEQQLKLAFISDAFTQDQVKEFRFSEDGCSGFYYILREIEMGIKHVVNELN